MGARQPAGLDAPRDLVSGRPGEHGRAERDLRESALRADPAGDPAIESLHEEARRALELFDSSRRVCATAAAPG
jgi:hypothetical protein